MREVEEEPAQSRFKKLLRKLTKKSKRELSKVAVQGSDDDAEDAILDGSWFEPTLS